METLVTIMAMTMAMTIRTFLSCSQTEAPTLVIQDVPAD